MRARNTIQQVMVMIVAQAAGISYNGCPILKALASPAIATVDPNNPTGNEGSRRIVLYFGSPIMYLFCAEQAQQLFLPILVGFCNILSMPLLRLVYSFEHRGGRWIGPLSRPAAIWLREGRSV